MILTKDIKAEPLELNTFCLNLKVFFIVVHISENNVDLLTLKD